MKRVLRILLNAATVLSLVLCAGTLVLWMRSYWTVDFLLWRSGGYASASVSVCRGSLDVMRARGIPRTFEHVRVAPDEAACPRWASAAGLRFGAAGFAFYAEPDVSPLGDGPGRQPVPFHELLVPLWAIVAASGVLPSAWMFGRARRRRRSRRGRCLECGYDLRATPDRCPECGTIVRSEVSAPHPSEHGSVRT
jgi:hypothetical protein